MTPGDRDLEAAQTVWAWLSLFDPVEPADAIVGLGSWDTRVAVRCADLWRAGLAARVLFTGNEGRFTAGRFTDTEARVFADVALAAGTPPDAITLEDRATNTGENILFTRRLIPDAAGIVFVSKPHMQRRVRATVRRHWPQVRGIYTAPLLTLEGEATADFPLAAILSEITGALHRMLTYPDLGFQAADPVPDSVRAAFETLVAAGHTADLP